eukprot:m.471913 g.471913  ORF g.471913 m.471913 type:complete len:130 (+) comp20379_c1_seq5:623-1012(+)
MAMERQRDGQLGRARARTSRGAAATATTVPTTAAVCRRATSWPRPWGLAACPFCFLHDQKNGHPRAKSKNLVHAFASRGNTANCIVYRGPPCAKGGFPKDEYAGFSIHIAKRTKRTKDEKGPPRRKRVP